MKNNSIYLFGMFVVMLAFASCKKEESVSGTKAVFSYVADGYKVDFTNFSTNATEYSWNFGDASAASTSKAPQHVYTKKGEFLVSLTIKNGAATSTFVDTIFISGPNIKIDGNFSDWDYVGYTHTNEVGTGGNINSIKTFASVDNLNFYIEGNSSMKMAIIDLYLDTDNNRLTGFATWMYPLGSGANFLCEGSPAGGWGNVLQHSGAQSAWSWKPEATFDTAMKFSTISKSTDKNIIEFSIKRNVLGSMRGSVNFALLEMTSGWAVAGDIPMSKTPKSIFAKIEL